MTSHYIYILQTKNNQLYTGYTTNIERRFKEHQSGIGAKFTKAFGAKELLYHEEFKTKSEALKREWEIKKMSRKQKWQLIEENLEK